MLIAQTSTQTAAQKVITENISPLLCCQCLVACNVTNTVIIVQHYIQCWCQFIADGCCYRIRHCHWNTNHVVLPWLKKCLNRLQYVQYCFSSEFIQRWILDLNQSSCRSSALQWSLCCESNVNTIMLSCYWSQVSLKCDNIELPAYTAVRHCINLCLATLPDETDAKKILTAAPLENWRRPPGCPRITWMKTIQQDLKSKNLSVKEAIIAAQNRPLWRLMSTFGATHS